MLKIINLPLYFNQQISLTNFIFEGPQDLYGLPGKSVHLVTFEQQAITLVALFAFHAISSVGLHPNSPSFVEKLQIIFTQDHRTNLNSTILDPTYKF